MGPGPEWPCERTLAGHTGGIKALAGWEGKLISGSSDKTIRVWDASTGGLDATLTGHRNAVFGLVVMGERLFSAAADGTIRVWTVGTWAAVTRLKCCSTGTQTNASTRTQPSIEYLDKCQNKPIKKYKDKFINKNENKQCIDIDSTSTKP